MEGLSMIKRFLSYVEIRTKITSVFAFAYSVAFLLYQKQKLHWGLTLLFFAAMLLFDLTTTAINNYIDARNDYQALSFRPRTALIMIYVLFTASAVLGLVLAYYTDLVVLLAGILCFLCGIFYTYGPLPISRMPLGEILSGIFYGLLIPFILLYINMPSGTFLTLMVSYSLISLQLQVLPILKLLIFSIIPFAVTANIMLANNICDMEKDILVKRHTLPYYIGSKALSLFAGLYYLTYAALILLVAMQSLSPVCLVSLITLVPVQGNINRFLKIQDKETTFSVAIKNYILIMGADTAMILFSVLIV